jgi:hypothetical protein
MGGARGTYGWEVRCLQCSGRETWEKRPLGWPRCRWKDNIKWIFKKWDTCAWTGLFWLRIGRNVQLFWMWWWSFGFHKMWGISLLAEDLLASQEGLWSLELVRWIVCLFVSEETSVMRLLPYCYASSSITKYVSSVPCSSRVPHCSAASTQLLCGSLISYLITNNTLIHNLLSHTHVLNPSVSPSKWFSIRRQQYNF